MGGSLVDDRTAALEFLKSCEHVTVAVIVDNEPWAVPVHIQKQDGFSFEWDSSKEAAHSKSIAANPRVALSLYRTDNGIIHEFGVYIKADAAKIADISEVKGRYKATPLAVWVNDEKHIKREIRL